MAAHQVATEDTSQSILALAQAACDYLDVGGVPRYGVCIDKSESDPSLRVTYLGAARNMRAAHMNFASGEFDYGDWADVWFVANNKPCMVEQSTREVDYYLDPNDYSKKEDGTDSDITDTSYTGNAMSQFPLVYFDQYESAGKEYIWACATQYNENYKAYAHTREDGSIADFFYWSIYGASLSDTTLRSLSGKTLQNSATTDTQLSQALANGTGWYIHTWSQRNYIQNLLTLLCCNDNTQLAFGNGNCREGTSATALLSTGTLDDKGQFWGSTSNTVQVKVFHIEQFWGDQWDRTAGLCHNSEGLLVQMTPPYNTTGEDYIRTGIVITGTSGGYISKTTMTEYGRLPTIASGSATTYECDGCYFNTTQLNYAAAGACASYAASDGGAFALSVYNAPSYASWARGCGLSCIQPAA